MDPVVRTGPENMAVDEWLLETMIDPILRVYRWQGRWGSLGCFGCLKEAIETNSKISWVRRSTGGGIVDHQRDWTYSFLIPATEKLVRLKPLESYRLIHERLNFVLIDRFNLCRSGAVEGRPGGVCFESPVEFDLIDGVGNKVAGAGQRRTKQGLLHQGSVAGLIEAIDSIDRSKRLAGALCVNWKEVEIDVPREAIEEKVLLRYGNPAWTARR